ncbi:MAG: hypothetical protein A2X01_09215 [Bacteroidetes bacterium GWF2_35_48]|nr:MAG: hypothetical protein A2X01_09215 [Bacteroidetes bacterium GWF2_35_48]
MGNKLLIILFLFISIWGYPQNLVTNLSFEEFTKCPDNWNDIKYVRGWEKSAMFSCDYYNSCGLDCVYIYKPFNAGRNWIGYQKPKSGYGYAGYIAYSEFLTSKLLEKLQFGKEYYVEAFVSLADKNEESSKNFGFLFSDEEITPSNLNKFKDNAIVIIQDYIDDKKNWTKICGTYLASGTEQYITIGNFIKKNKYKHLKSNKIKRKRYTPPYYYIDDISVKCANCHQKSQDSLITKSGTFHNVEPVTLIEQNSDNNFDELNKANDYFTLKNLLFVTDSSTILSQSYKELDMLVSYLVEHPAVKIEIRGHTDNTGKEEYNIELSKNRAKTVAVYLINKGIEKSRIFHNGFGSSTPIASNNDSIGKGLNRRVEIKFF